MGSIYRKTPLAKSSNFCEKVTAVRIKIGKSVLQILFLVCSLLVLILCDKAPAEVSGSGISETKDASFEAIISGYYAGDVHGNGVLKFLPQAGFNKQGYYFLADSQGIRAHGVTFVLPRGLTTGKHKLGNPSPIETGTVPSVRVDRDMGNAVASYQTNTTGFLNVMAFPNDEKNMSGSVVAGSFEFTSEDSKGQKISVKGKFSFKIK